MPTYADWRDIKANASDYFRMWGHMGFRFRRRIRIARGLSLNISKSGISTSVGGRGATLNISKRGTRTTLGLPGTGLSYRSPTQPWNDGAGTASSSATPRASRLNTVSGIALAIFAFALLMFLMSAFGG